MIVSFKGASFNLCKKEKNATIKENAKPILPKRKKELKKEVTKYSC